MARAKKNEKSGAYGRLSRALIVGAAVALADEVGMAGVSMAAVARRAGASTMALYYHVDDKDDLLWAMVETITSEFELVEDEDWEAAVHAMIVSMYSALTRHPWAASFMLSDTSHPSIFSFLSLMAEHLQRGGIPVEARSHVVHSLYIHVFAQANRDAVLLPAGRERVDEEEAAAQLRADGHGAYAEIMGYLPRTPEEGEAELRFVVDGLLAQAKK